VLQALSGEDRFCLRFRALLLPRPADVPSRAFDWEQSLLQHLPSDDPDERGAIHKEVKEFIPLYVQLVQHKLVATPINLGGETPADVAASRTVSDEAMTALRVGLGAPTLVKVGSDFVFELSKILTPRYLSGVPG
jgi:hypothetical protein